MISIIADSFVQDFLTKTKGSREVSLVIAKDEHELLSFKKNIEEQGFNKSESIRRLMVAKQSYFVIDVHLGKKVYDFMVQYPTGQVEIFSKKLMKSEIISPDYENSSIVFLIDKNVLQKFQQAGIDLLSVVGLTYQS